MLYFKQHKTDLMFFCVNFSFLNYVMKRKLMTQIQAMPKLLSYEIERIPNKWKQKVESQY